MDKKKKKGFTLVELIVVLAILAILAAMLVPALTGYIDKANEKKAIATARQYYVAAHEIKGITVSISGNKIGKLSSIQIGNDTDETPEDNKYFQSFLNLAELTDDTSYIHVIFSNQTVYSFYVKIGNKRVTLRNGEWIVEPYDH